MGQMIEFASNGGTCPGYLGMPESGHGPGVVVIQEWWGLVPHIEQVVDRFAANGFVALAPDLYRGMRTTEPDEAGKLMMGLRIEQAAVDISGAAAALVAREETVGSAVGVVGFCMGGGLALLAGATAPNVVAVSAFYPAMPWSDYAPDWSAFAGRSAQIHTSQSDGGSEAEHIQNVQTAMTMGGGTVEVFDYAGSDHAFFNDHRPEVYDQSSADLAFQRTINMFASRLGV